MKKNSSLSVSSSAGGRAARANARIHSLTTENQQLLVSANKSFTGAPTAFVSGTLSLSVPVTFAWPAGAKFAKVRLVLNMVCVFTRATANNLVSFNVSTAWVSAAGQKPRGSTGILLPQVVMNSQTIRMSSLYAECIITDHTQVNVQMFASVTSQGTITEVTTRTFAANAEYTIEYFSGSDPSVQNLV